MYVFIFIIFMCQIIQPFKNSSTDYCNYVMIAIIS